MDVALVMVGFVGAEIIHMPMEKCTLNFDKNIFTKEAIIYASYDFSNDYFINIYEDNNNIIIQIEPKLTDMDKVYNISSEFRNHVLDHQVRLKIEKDYKVIREIIIAQAFAPCENLDEILNNAKP